MILVVCNGLLLASLRFYLGLQYLDRTICCFVGLFLYKQLVYMRSYPPLYWLSTEHVPVFPRYRIRDPYKLLGVDRDASEEEIRSARNFLIQQYAGHEPSEEAIEGAYEKIIMKSYQQRKKTKINLKTKLKKRVEEYPSWVKALIGYFEVPSMDIISRRLFFFAFIAGWSIATSAENGPAFQVCALIYPEILSSVFYCWRTCFYLHGCSI